MEFMYYCHKCLEKKENLTKMQDFPKDSVGF